MNEPVFIARTRVEAIHRRSLEEHGGQDGIRNEHGLDSALAQPMNVYFYGQGDLYDMAAATPIIWRKTNPSSTETNAQPSPQR
ncbi:MAG: hypothetical protein ABIO94_09720 [Opitutaceae bacterium]